MAPGLMTAMGIIAALYQRERTGRGQHIEVAMTDQVSTFIRIHYGYPIEQNVPTPRPGNWVPFTRKIAPAEAYPCKPFGPNDWVFMHVSSNAQWYGVLDVVGRQDLKDDPRFATPVTRGAHRAETNQVVIDWLRDHTKIEAMETFCRAGVPAGAVRDTLEVLNDPDLRRRGIFVTVQDPDRGEVTIPAGLSRCRTPTSTSTPRPAPASTTRRFLAACSASPKPRSANSPGRILCPHLRKNRTSSASLVPKHAKIEHMVLQGDYAPSPAAWVRDQVEAYERTGGQDATTLRDTASRSLS